ncbi:MULTISPECIES: nitroreductase family deazaflavin-dependent oxidoreductase [unclassified Diaminobutyricimonas]|uniref:nitroreductase family deazaflavin-dependent oxidoreductase n=1 Tax=unclassified Diaminobutyricimonas TaxID=2643261 RepID=UPI0012F4FBEA|nr:MULTISPECIES: nitroreductase family deazaflavin-dependent oxidoreductase [unclassified Diaminobutyricimonas]
MPLTGDYAPSTSGWAREQAELFEASGGTKGTTLQGKPVIVLTSVGAKSGKLRKTVLMRVEHDGKYAVIGSRGGAARHPAWVFNLRTHPHVELQDGPVKRDYTAVEVTGAEREEWWQRAVNAFSPYAAYQKRTKRLIPVFVLTPIEG